MNARSIASVVLTLLLLTVVLWADEQAPEEKLSKELIGTWKLVSAKYGGIDQGLPSQLICLKHITPTHQTWMRIESDSGEVVTIACGKWSIKGDQFSATPEFGMGTAFSSVKGTKNTFTCKIDGNRWFHAGLLRKYDLTLEEVWERQRPQDAEPKDGSTK